MKRKRNMIKRNSGFVVGCVISAGASFFAANYMMSQNYILNPDSIEIIDETGKMLEPEKTEDRTYETDPFTVTASGSVIKGVEAEKTVDIRETETEAEETDKTETDVSEITETDASAQDAQTSESDRTAQTDQISESDRTVQTEQTAQTEKRQTESQVQTGTAAGRETEKISDSSNNSGGSSTSGSSSSSTSGSSSNSSSSTTSGSSTSGSSGSASGNSGNTSNGNSSSSSGSSSGSSSSGNSSSSNSGNTSNGNSSSSSGSSSSSPSYEGPDIIIIDPGNGDYTYNDSGSSGSSSNSSSGSTSNSGSSSGGTSNSGSSSSGNSSSSSGSSSSGSSSSGTPGDVMLWGISSRYISESELYNYSSAQLRIMRNEILALNGRIFRSQDLIDYFSQKSWYTPTYDPDEFDANMFYYLNDYEEANLQVILDYEDALAGY